MKTSHQNPLTPPQNSFRTFGTGRRFLAACAIVMLCGSGLQAKTPQWEYRVVSAATNNRTLETLLNSNGAQGWELVQVDRGVVIFKRLKK